VVETALLNIYNKTINVKKQIEPGLFSETLNNLNKAVEVGVIKAVKKLTEPDQDFLNELKNGNKKFTAYRTHRFQNDLAAKMVGEDGKLRSYADFKTDAESIIGQYNQNWLKTEYNTAVISSRNASNFKKFERDADLFPNLEWLPSTSVEVIGEHVALYHTIKPINDAFWDANYPGDLWNCKCGVTNTDEKPTDGTPTADYEPEAGLDENPAKTGAVFSDSHPYVAESYDGADKAVKSFLKGLE